MPNDIKITLTIEGLTEAVNNLANAINNRTTAIMSATDEVHTLRGAQAISNNLIAAQQQATPSMAATETVQPPIVIDFAKAAEDNRNAALAQVTANLQNNPPVGYVPQPQQQYAPQPQAQQQYVPQPQQQAAPTATPANFTLEQLAVAATPLMDAGKMDQLTALMARFGVAALTQLNPSQYGAFATELRALGARI
jgi:hypothetical protein